MAGKVKLSTENPTEGAGAKYKYPLERGLPKLSDRHAADGSEILRTGYGSVAYAGPSSVGIGESGSDGLSDFDINPKTRDAVRDELASAGFKDKALGAPVNPVADLQRKIGTKGYPINPGTKDASSGPKIPGTLIPNEAQPVRKPE